MSLRGPVLAAIAARPGIRHSVLVQRIGCGNGAVAHHVHDLEAAGRIKAYRSSRFTCYFVKGNDPSPELIQRQASLGGRTARRLALQLAESPGLRLSEVAQRLGLAASTAHYHVRKLIHAGILHNRHDKGLALTTEGQKCLTGPPAT